MERKGKPGIYILWKVNVKALLGAVLCAAAVVTVRAAAVPRGVDVPVVMYHALLKDEARHGNYVISPAEFENDLQYLKKHGYTTVLVADLIAYTRGEGELPEKPILLTFDDGYYNNYLYAFEIAKRYQCKFVISPIGFWADWYTETGEENAYYTHATWGQLREMADSGLVEVQNHSYDLHKSGMGVKKVPGESEEQYRKRLTEDVTLAQETIEAHLGKRPTAFFYPFGAMSRTTPGLIREMGFAATFTCEEHVSCITRDPGSLYGLGRYLRVSGVSSERFFMEKVGLK